ncbi:hypothetical protein L0F63_003371 [Massospora cicadina]|nr:hypothetical protein L0F63_003371 [Massospora cicadina]
MSYALQMFKSAFQKHAKLLIETEESMENWYKIRNSLMEVQKLCTEEVCTDASFPTQVATIIKPVAKYIFSDRTLLSKSAVDLSIRLVEVLKQKFSAFVDTLCPAIAKILGKPSKIYRDRGFECLSLVVKVTRTPRLVAQVCEYSLAKSTIARPYGIKLLNELVSSYPEAILLASHKQIEAALIKGLLDPELTNRSFTRNTIRSYILKLPSRREAIVACVSKLKLKFLDLPASVANSYINAPAEHSRSSSIISANTRPPKLTNHPMPNIAGAKSRILGKLSQTQKSASSSTSRTLKLVNHPMPNIAGTKSRVMEGLSQIQESASSSTSRTPKLINHLMSNIAGAKSRVMEGLSQIQESASSPTTWEAFAPKRKPTGDGGIESNTRVHFLGHLF